MNVPLTVNCPHCDKVVEWTDEFEFKPFCSERCKLIDLGAWHDESYGIDEQDEDGGATTLPNLDQ